ncbi:MAG: SDR family oxidoreductase [Candidatus Marinimicrobia bacterium]|nr:SDR family oxidoreductase [Candidatus Neomarinimicrobiota bacterium]
MARNILITGATAGFGKSIAERFATEGWNLILVGRRAERLKAISAELGKKVAVLPVTLDVCRRKAVEQAFTELPEKFKAIDILVNNAGLAAGLGPAQSADLDDWDAMVDTNIKGLMYMTRAILPGMVARNSGHIVNIGSISGSWPYEGGNVYGGTKAFVAQFSRNLRPDLSGTAIRVTNIEPGIAETEFSLVRFKGDTVKAKAVYQGCQPLTAEDIAEIVFWVTHLPAHVNVNDLEVMPVCQSWAGYKIHRE